MNENEYILLFVLAFIGIAIVIVNQNKDDKF
jgi:hypothetical protein